MTQAETLNPTASVSARLSSILSGGSLSGVSPIKMRASSFDVNDHDGEYANGDKVREIYWEIEREGEEEREREVEREKE